MRHTGKNSLMLLLFVLFMVEIKLLALERSTVIDALPPTTIDLLKHQRRKDDRKTLSDIDAIVKKAVKREKSKERKNRVKCKNNERNKDGQKELEATLTPFVRRLLSEQYEDKQLLAKKISVRLKDVDINDAIALISKISGVMFIVDSNVTGQVKNFVFNDVSLAVIMRILLGNNTPRLALVKHLNVWRVVTVPVAIAIFKVFEDKQQEKDIIATSKTIFYAKWNNGFKQRVEKLWHGVIGGPKAVAGGQYLIFDDASKKIFFKGSQRQVADFSKWLKEIDYPVPQVRVAVRVVLADKDFEEAFGVEWSGVYNRANTANETISRRGYGFAGMGIGMFGPPHGAETHDLFKDLLGWSLNFIPTKVTNAFNVKLPFVWGNKDFSTRRLNLLLNAAENSNEIKTILKPTLLVNNEEVAEILVGEELPQQVRLDETVEGKLTNITTVNYKDIGMKIKVKPVVAPDNKAVFLDIFVESSSVVQSSIPPTGNNAQLTGTFNYTIRTSRSRNRVLLKSGQTTLIGGLIVNNKEHSTTGIPLLKEIPVLGWLFKGSRKRIKDEQLLIFITPTLV